MLANRRALVMHLSRLIRSSPRPNPSAAAVAAAQYISSFPAPQRLPLKVGDVLRETRRFSSADVAAYAAVSGDQNPVHLHPDFARRVAGFDGGAVVHGMLVASLFPSIIASNFPGTIYVSQTLQFKLPVYIEDEVVAEVQAINLREHKKRYVVKFTTKCLKNQENLLIDGEATAILPTLIPI